VQIGVGEPQPALPDLLGAEPNVRAPAGGSFVRVDVTLVEGGRLPLAAVAAPFAQETEVVLRAAGRDYLVNGPGGIVVDPNGLFDRGGSRWVAVDGTPRDLEVRVTVDGVTQVVAADGSVDAGRATELEALPSLDEVAATEPRPCGPVRRLDDTDLRNDYRAGLRCQVQLALRTTYVDGIGWAEPGREFLVVHLVLPTRVRFTTGRGDATQFWNSEMRFETTVGGAGPVAGPVDVNSLNAGSFGIQDPETPEQVVFDVPLGDETGELVVGLVAAAQPTDPFDDTRREVRYQWTVAGTELA
jgi:hypothetical protein